MNRVRVLFGSVAVAAFVGVSSASATDLYRSFYKSPVANTWTGCYAGVNGGWGWGDSQYTAGVGGPGASPPYTTLGGVPGFEVSHDIDGGVVGAHIGCQYQWTTWVFGLELAGDWAAIDGSTSALVPLSPSQVRQDSFDARIRSLITATPRVGYAWNNWLFYAKLGLAAAEADVTFTRLSASSAGDFFSGSESRVGWTIGMGAEWLLTPNWVVGLEYDYADLGSDSVGGRALTPAGIPTSSVFLEEHKLQVNELLGRLSYKLDWNALAALR